MLFAPHYARAELCRVIADSVMVRARPAEQAPATSQLAHGEGFALIDKAGDWAWGRCLHDDYVGYVPADRLGPMQAPTHRVTAPLALVFANPDIKAPVGRTLPIGAQIAGNFEDGYLRTADGYIHPRHVAPIGSPSSSRCMSLSRGAAIPASSSERWIRPEQSIPSPPRPPQR